MTLARASLLLLLALAAAAPAQEPNRAAIAGSKEDEDSVDRGATLFAARCATCHGPAAKGTTPATDLIRSTLVRDDEKGELIAPVLREGRPAAGMPRPALTAAQIEDLTSWLHVQIYAAANRDTYAFLNILTGDAKQGERYFNGEGHCNSCHSPTGDLTGIGAKYDPPVLQSVWLNPSRTRGKAASKAARTATVTPLTGPPLSGVLEHLDEFNLVLRDAAGALHSFTLDGDTPHVEIEDPLQPHFALYRKLTDADIHNMTAYLATLQ